MHAPLYDVSEIKRILEAALLTTQEPLSVEDLRKLFEDQLSADTSARYSMSYAPSGTAAAWS